VDELRKQTSPCIRCNNCTFNFNRDHPFAVKPALDGLCDKALVTTPVDVIIGPLVGSTAYCQSWNEKAKAALPLLLSGLNFCGALRGLRDKALFSPDFYSALDGLCDKALVTSMIGPLVGLT